MMVHICDRCRKIIGESKDIGGRIQFDKNDEGVHEGHGIDLCRECTKEFEEWFNKFYSKGESNA